jgi:small subunit ribosomal protein S16
VAVKIKLKRLGKIRAPYYRIVIADSRTKRDGRAIEEIGKYHPKAEPSFIEVNSERAQHWLSVGAQPTDPVRKILEITGDWQKFKGLPGAEGTLRTAEPKADRTVAFAAAVAETLTDSGVKAKPKGKADAKPAEAKSADAKTGARTGGRSKKAAETAEARPAAGTAAAEAPPAAETATADAPPAAETATADAPPAAETATADVPPAAETAADETPAAEAPPAADAAAAETAADETPAAEAAAPSADAEPAPEGDGA